MEDGGGPNPAPPPHPLQPRGPAASPGYPAAPAGSGEQCAGHPRPPASGQGERCRPAPSRLSPLASTSGPFPRVQWHLSSSHSCSSFSTQTPVQRLLLPTSVSRGCSLSLLLCPKTIAINYEDGFILCHSMSGKLPAAVLCFPSFPSLPRACGC